MLWNNKKLGSYGAKLNDNVMALQSGDCGAIPRVFWVFAENNAAAKTKAAEILDAVFEKMTFDDLVRIDEQMRQTTSIEWFIDWRKLSLNSFFTLKMSEAARRAVIVFASFNPNGYIREQAVRSMKNHEGTLPYAILRQNDWVSQVRSAANETVDYRLLHLAAGELVAALPFADKLSRCKRMSNTDTYINRIYATLTSTDYDKELSDAFNMGSIRTRRICTSALFSPENPRYDLAVIRMEAEADPFLRSYIFRQLMAADQNLNITAEWFLTDKYPLNRLLAFEYICGDDQIKALQLAQDLLLDKNLAVRKNVRSYMNNNVPGFNYRAYYESYLGDCAVPAILGLGETGTAEDTNKIHDYLKSTQVSVVRAAMTAVMRLDSAKYVKMITDFLSDKRPGVVKTARNLIIKTAAPDYNRVMEIFRATTYSYTKQKCFSILLTARKWQRLEFILEVLEIGGDEMAEPVIAALGRWIKGYNCSFAVPTPAQIARITESVQRLGDKLPATTQHTLLFLLR